MSGTNRIQVLVGCALILTGIFAFISASRPYYSFPVGDMVLVQRGEVKYVGAFYFRYNKEGWVSVNYKLPETIWEENIDATLSQVIFPARIGNFFDVNSHGIKFGFKVVDIGETYVVLQRYW